VARVTGAKFSAVGVAVLGAAFGLGFVGFLDDFLKIRHQRSLGLNKTAKFAGQAVIAVVFSLLVLREGHEISDLSFIRATGIDLGLFFYVWSFVILSAASNGVNLTDGLDGLAAGLTAIAAGAFAIFAYLFGRVDAARYLGVLHLPGAGELTIFCGALMGAGLGFLWFNAHPAQVFMGDTGALAIGGALGTVAILLKTEFLLLIAGGVFAAETVSVMLQTGVYRWHKRRRGKEYADAHKVFRMAPLHHHFEKLGWAEPQIVMRFYILGVLCAMIALATLKVR